MPNITSVTFYFANPTLDINGNPVLTEPPESHTLTWQQVIDNVGFSLSTGESMFTELPDPAVPEAIRLVNGFYFGTGKYGSILAIQYHYDDGIDGWVSNYASSGNTINLNMIYGDWIKGLSYTQIKTNPHWIGQPYIGYENDWIEVRIERKLPPISLTLLPATQTVNKGDSITFNYSSIDSCTGDATYIWSYDTEAIQELSLSMDTHILQFKQAGTYTITLTAMNTCSQTQSITATITVQDIVNVPCDIQLTPSMITIHLGETATFDAIHPYVEIGTWTHDLTLTEITKSSKLLTVQPTQLGSYSIQYQVNSCLASSILYVLEASPIITVDPIEPAPPDLPNTPPDTGEIVGLIIQLLDASIPISPLYKYPNIMKRNARYRGHRESEKVLQDHQEQIYDIRQIYKDLTSLEVMKDTTIDSWFNGVDNLSISMNAVENQSISVESQMNHTETDVDSIRALEDNMVQLNWNNFVEYIVGIYGIKRRMQELDERIAEAERRYRDYENAYE